MSKVGSALGVPGARASSRTLRAAASGPDRPAALRLASRHAARPVRLEARSATRRRSARSGWSAGGLDWNPYCWVSRCLSSPVASLACIISFVKFSSHDYSSACQSD